MDTTSWLQIALVCVLGAMSPGPSLAAVIGNTIAQGRIYGIVFGVGHGAGIALWASLTAVGIGRMVVEISGLLLSAQLLGAGLLAYIGFRTIGAGLVVTARTQASSSNVPQVLFRGAGEGFLVSLLNPKIALFFLAIFSQFVQSDSGWLHTGLLGVTAGLIDAVWYVMVAFLVSSTIMPSMFQTKVHVISKVSGSLLVLIAVYLMFAIIQDLLRG